MDALPPYGEADGSSWTIPMMASGLGRKGTQTPSCAATSVDAKYNEYEVGDWPDDKTDTKEHVIGIDSCI